jgi:hypothetical protein
MRQAARKIVEGSIRPKIRRWSGLTSSRWFEDGPTFSSVRTIERLEVKPLHLNFNGSAQRAPVTVAGSDLKYANSALSSVSFIWPNARGITAFSSVPSGRFAVRMT